MQILLAYTNLIRPSIEFTMPEEEEAKVAFPEVLITGKEHGLKPPVYPKVAFTGQCLNNN